MRRAARLSLPLIALLALALLGASLFVGARPAEAQGSWSCTWGGSYGWSSWYIISGWGSIGSTTITSSYVSNRTRIGAELDFTSTTLTSLTATYTTSITSNLVTDSYFSYSGEGAGTYTKSWSGSSSNNRIYLEFYGNSGVSGSYTLSQVTASGTGTAPSSCPGAPTNTPTITPTPSNTPTVTPSPTPTATRSFYFSPVIRADLSAVEYWRKFPATITRVGNDVVVGLIAVAMDGSPTGQFKVNEYPDGYQDMWGNNSYNVPPVGGLVVDSAAQNFVATAYPGANLAQHGIVQPGIGTPAGEEFQSEGGGDWVEYRWVLEGVPSPTPTYAPAPTVTLDCPAETWPGVLNTILATTNGAPISTWAWDFGDGETSADSDGSVDHTWAAAGAVTLELTVTGPGGTDTESCEINVLRVGQPGGDGTIGAGALYRPIHTSDTNTTYYDGLFSAASGWFDENQDSGGVVSVQHTVIGLTENAGANVYAVADGEVLSVQNMGRVGDAAERCRGIVGSSEVTFACAIQIYENDDATGVDTLVAQYAVDMGPVYRVTMSYASNMRIEYYVTDAPTYVREGQILSAGCIVGLSVSLSSNGGVDIGTPIGGTWLRALDAGGDQWPILPQLFVDPDPATACNAGGEYSDCLFDPLFSNQGGYTWQRQGGVSFADGVTLEPGASISLQGLNLDAATAYSFTVWTETPRTYSSGDARITLGIGTTETSFLIDASIRTQWRIAPATHTPDQGSLYSIRIINSGRAPFTVLQNCVSTGEPDTAPASCYFQNFSFDGQLTNWSTGGTIVPADAPGSLYIMEDLATIGQNVKLYADGGGGDHEYTVRLEGVLHATANSLIQVRYRYGGGGWILPDVNGWTLSQQSLTALQRTYVLEFDVPSGTFSGLMEFQFDFTPTGGDVVGDTLSLQLYSLCLQDAGGFSHHPGGDGSNWTPGTGCDNSAPPAELQDDFGAWIAYHLDGMQDIYYCDVIPQLERLNNITYGIYEYAQWSGLYSQAAQAQMMLWADRQLFPWLGGYLSNIANAAGGRITVDPGGGCHDLFCLLDAIVQSVIGPVVDIVSRIIDTILSLINTAANLLIPLIEAVVGFFVTIINGLGSIINSLITLITAFITGISNAQPAPVPGLPNCGIDPGSSAICAVMYGLQNTVFADEGAAIIPLFIAILSIAYLQWLIGKITELIAEVTDRI